MIFVRSNSAILILRDLKPFPANIEHCIFAFNFLDVYRPEPSTNDCFAIRQLRDDVDIGLFVKALHICAATIAQAGGNVRRNRLSL